MLLAGCAGHHSFVSAIGSPGTHWLKTEYDSFEYPIPVAEVWMDNEALQVCPGGYERTREGTIEQGEERSVFWEIRCKASPPADRAS